MKHILYIAVETNEEITDQAFQLSHIYLRQKFKPEHITTWRDTSA